MLIRLAGCSSCSGDVDPGQIPNCVTEVDAPFSWGIKVMDHRTAGTGFEWSIQPEFLQPCNSSIEGMPRITQAHIGGRSPSIISCASAKDPCRSRWGYGHTGLKRLTCQSAPYSSNKGLGHCGNLDLRPPGRCAKSLGSQRMWKRGEN